MFLRNLVLNDCKLTLFIASLASALFPDIASLATEFENVVNWVFVVRKDNVPGIYNFAKTRVGR